MSDACRWIRSNDVPGGKFLVPGCWSRVVGGDYADCHCSIEKNRIDTASRIERLEAKIADLEARMDSPHPPTVDRSTENE